MYKRQVQPWSKENPAYSQGFGIYLGDGNILTAANIVYSASFVEVTSADGSQTVPVTVTAFDPEANLALLRLKNEADAAFLDKLVPVTLGNAPRLGDKVTFWQFNDDGLPITTSGTLLATESSSPFTNSEPFVLDVYKRQRSGRPAPASSATESASGSWKRP